MGGGLDTGSTCNIEGGWILGLPVTLMGGLDTGSTCNIEGGWILGLPVTLRGAGCWVYL